MLLPASTGLPVEGALTELADALRAHRAAVLVAPPGTGKTTLVPLVLADEVSGTVLVAEPRRVAARAAARRMASLVGDPSLVGHTVRGESTVGPRTRVEVVTTGVLVRRLQRDPSLDGVGAVVLDECHERHLDTDLALAFALDVRAALREDLLLLAMSATAQAERLSALMGAPVVTATGALHPVEVLWCPPPVALPPAYGTRVDPRLLDHVADVVRRALEASSGDVLVFLPGVGEIETVGRRLGRLGGLDVHPLHGRLPPRAQDAALTPGPRRRVVLATAVAESSLTVPGVRVVVDAGLARVPRTDLARGLGALATVPVSRASAEQRAGRAGREAPGQAHRCWSQAEHARLPAHAEPEVATADLTAFVLELACWGGTPTLLDPLPDAARQVALAALTGLGALDRTGAVTARGRTLNGVGAHPRLARALLDGAPLVGSRRAAEVVAVLSEDGPGGRSDDLAEVLRELRRRPTAAWSDEVRRLSGRVPAVRRTQEPDDRAAGLVVGLAFPERLARVRSGGDSYLMTGGTGASLAPGTALRGAPWLAVAVADRGAGRRDAQVRLAVAVDESTALQAAEALRSSQDEVVWEAGDVRARTVDRVGALMLRERALRPEPQAAEQAVREGLRAEGLDLLRWSEPARSLRARLGACHAGLGAPWPDVGDVALLEALPLTGARTRADLLRLDVLGALRALMPWQVAGRLDEVAPEQVRAPSGQRFRVDYADPEGPTVSLRVQEALGWTGAPQVAGRPLRLQLLSPARRVVAVTSDLSSFWVTGYPGVRADLRGRYPKHAWPADPLSAPP